MRKPVPARPLLGSIYALAWLLVLAVAALPNMARVYVGCWSQRQLVLVAAMALLLVAAMALLRRGRAERLARWLRQSPVRLAVAVATGPAAVLATVVVSIAWAVPWTATLLWSFVGLLVLAVAWSVFVVAAGRDPSAGRAALKRAATAWLATFLAIGFVEIVGQLGCSSTRFVPLLNPPDLRARFRTAEFDTLVVTNRQGLRATTDYGRKVAGRWRVVVVGDSMTFGWGVDNHETYPAVAEQLLNARPGSASVEFVNMGRAGQSPVEYLRALRPYAAELEPDFVVVGLLAGNDCPVWHPPSLRDEAELGRRLGSIVAVADGEAAGAGWRRSFVLRVLHSQATRGLYWWAHRGHEGAAGPVWGEPNPLDPAAFAATIRRRADRQEIEQRYQTAQERGFVRLALDWQVAPWLVRAALLHPTGIADALGVRDETRPALELEWRLCEGLLAKIHEVAQHELGAELVVLLIPSAYQVSARYHAFPRELGCEMPPALLSSRATSEWLAAYCRRTGLVCVDPLRRFRQHETADELYFVRDAHMTPAGYRLLAEALAEALASRMATRMVSAAE